MILQERLLVNAGHIDLPQLIVQFTGEGQAFNNKNWQGWRGAINQYRENMTTDSNGGVLSTDNGRLNQIMKKVPEKPFTFM